MEINKYLVIAVIILILIVYYLYKEKESFKNKLSNYDELPDKIVDKILTKKEPNVNQIDSNKVETTNKKEELKQKEDKPKEVNIPKTKEEILKELYAKYGI